MEHGHQSLPPDPDGRRRRPETRTSRSIAAIQADINALQERIRSLRAQQYAGNDGQETAIIATATLIAENTKRIDALYEEKRRACARDRQREALSPRQAVRAGGDPTADVLAAQLFAGGDDHADRPATPPAVESNGSPLGRPTDP